MQSDTLRKKRAIKNIFKKNNREELKSCKKFQEKEPTRTQMRKILSERRLER